MTPKEVMKMTPREIINKLVDRTSDCLLMLEELEIRRGSKDPTVKEEMSNIVINGANISLLAARIQRG